MISLSIHTDFHGRLSVIDLAALDLKSAIVK